MIHSQNRIGKSNKNETPEIKEPPKDLKMYPNSVDGKPHPLPLYMTEEVTLPPYTDPPWKEALEREERERFKEFCRDPMLPHHFRDTFLKDALDEEILALASLSITQMKTQKTIDHESEIFIEEQIFLPTVQREVFVSVWELLYDWGRDITLEELKDMQSRENQLQMSSQAKEILNAHMLEGLNWREDLSDETKLSGERWEVLLFNYATKLQQNSFKRNSAFHILQERVISQAATDEVCEGVFSYLEKDMIDLDEKEKTKVPPRAARGGGA